MEDFFSDVRSLALHSKVQRLNQLEHPVVEAPSESNFILRFYCDPHDDLLRQIQHYWHIVRDWIKEKSSSSSLCRRSFGPLQVPQGSTRLLWAALAVSLVDAGFLQSVI